jgi:hypothetical protein
VRERDWLVEVPFTPSGIRTSPLNDANTFQLLKPLGKQRLKHQRFASRMSLKCVLPASISDTTSGGQFCPIAKAAEIIAER